MSLVDYLLTSRTPLELAKELAHTVKENVVLRDRVGELECILFWMQVKERNEDALRLEAGKEAKIPLEGL